MNKRKILQFILKIFARLMLARHRPTVIGVTGSVGKTSAKEAIYAVLHKRHSVWKSGKNYNTEIGVPLAVFGISDSGYNSAWRWLLIFLQMAKRLIKFSGYPDFLILELGVDKPGDMKYLADLARPQIGIITAIGEVPVHVENFPGPKELAREKLRLMKALPHLGYAILNRDDAALMEEAGRTNAKILTYGFDASSDVRAGALETRSEDAVLSFKIEYRGSFVPVRLKNVFGKTNVYAALAGAAAGLALGMNLIEVSEGLLDYAPPPGRLRLIPGVKNSRILDDTYNASPLSVAAALEVLKNLESGRDIVVLGDMKELGKYAESAHRAAGKLISNFVSEIWLAGDLAKLIGEEAVLNGFDESKVHYFQKSEEIGRLLQDSIKPGDLILVKGSQSMRMEKVVEEIMAEPEKAKELLVRQGPPWK